MPGITSDILQFYGYSVPKINFKIGENFSGEKLQIDVKMSRHVEPIQKKDSDSAQHFIVSINLILGTEENKECIFADIVVNGDFSSNSTPFPLDNATAILFPYVRSVVASVCLAANIAPLILPTINVLDAFKSDRDND